MVFSLGSSAATQQVLCLVSHPEWNVSNLSEDTPTRTKRTPKKLIGWKTFGLPFQNIRPLGSKIQPCFFGESVFLLALGAGKELLSLRVLVHRYFAQLFFGGIFVAGAVAAVGRSAGGVQVDKHVFFDASHGGEWEVMIQKHRIDSLDIYCMYQWFYRDSKMMKVNMKHDNINNQTWSSWIIMTLW